VTSSGVDAFKSTADSEWLNKPWYNTDNSASLKLVDAGFILLLENVI